MWGSEVRGAPGVVRAEVSALVLDRGVGGWPGCRVSGYAGARIVGDLNLSDTTIEAKVQLLDCHIAGTVPTRRRQDQGRTAAALRHLPLPGQPGHGRRAAALDLRRIGRPHGGAPGQRPRDRAAEALRHAGGHPRRGAGVGPAARGVVPGATPGATPGADPVERARGLRGAADLGVGRAVGRWARRGRQCLLRDMRATGGLRLIGARFSSGLYLQGAVVTAEAPPPCTPTTCRPRRPSSARGFTAHGNRAAARRAHRRGPVVPRGGAAGAGPGCWSRATCRPTSSILLPVDRRRGQTRLLRFGVLFDRRTATRATCASTG